ncbi:hypothetical protein EJ04DRAFT_223386 [Polyplosphaeria fusca]|uniref:C2H2-type domain-containing protein n=1 Tax=Polyplosphaeria fusca TaxID=682080 RepID=A0A9P4QYS1_9PLEO|nr:hypothetical protein EJ04DRAFT_223386 [Polyplosphaeria fusca]
MNSRDQHTPPFNSPYQQAMKASATLLQQPSYPSPAHSDSEPCRYPADGLGLYSFTQPFPGPDSHSSFTYPPSPQPTEAWAHLTTGVSPLLPEGSPNSWTTAYEHSTSRSPLPWTDNAVSDRSSLSSTHDMSHYSRESSVHVFPQIKLEGATNWATEHGMTSPGMHPQQQPLTVSPERLTTGLCHYEASLYSTPQLPKMEMPVGVNFNQAAYRSVSYDSRSKSRRRHSESRGLTARTRSRREPTTPENAQYQCEICHRLFQRSYNHKTHMETHNPRRKRDHPCPHEGCVKSFVRKTDLDRHDISVHQKLKEYPCSKCNAQFARKDTLRRHEEDGCSKRLELNNTDVLSRRASMRAVPAAQVSYYQSPPGQAYEAQSPTLFRDESFPGSPSDY